ncbi:MAG: insulinase family protein [Pelatocladus maniniholoensis HA4357-MV3]|jgi:zinc protease|uniref:Insulinase family protein n=1 Tax=Pelatocladus maniniholoensis HA4357-MV3 TaxID=1117104 RepID=A0A9E3HE28_9NOST|nr:insulinase family protein [Pelatocladus maniniholoensis HA4357-MV3]BAZ67300.1 peptidase M16 domain-containing protein [Fischerella sp. NIES-4106]
MSVFNKLHRYRFSIIVLTLWLIAVLLLSDGSATSHTNAISSLVKIHKEKALKKTSKNYVTENVYQTVLENGLIVLTKEVHSAPVVSVQVWYEVGSRNEQAGVNGIAHQLEHMMFKGTKDRPVQFGRLFSALGSDSNAFTSYDQTAYYGTAERDKLNALLMLEADRMQNALIDAEKLASEKRVVISELQGYENSPEYRLNRAVLQKVFPEHPYGLPVGGTKADVEKFQVKQVQEYYRKFYRPDNAVLVIVGDFDTANTLKVVKDVFGKIQKSQDSNVKSQVSSVNSQKLSHSPIVLREPGANALLHAIYPLPDVNHPDIPALDVMDYILTEGRNSRLDQALVESGMATDVTGSIVSLRETGWYELSVTATPDENLTKIDAVMQKAIATLASQKAKVEEVNRAKAQLEASVVLNNRDITSQAMQLGNDKTTSGDYNYTDRYLAAVRRVTATDVQRVVNKYLKPKARSFGFFEPTQIQASQKSDGKSHSTLITENFSENTPKVATEVMKYLPPVDLTTHPTNLTLPQQFKLSNGIEVLLLPDKSTPTVTLSGYIKAGNEFDPEDKVGLASLVAENLMNGTKTRNVLAIAKTLDERGASLDFESYREGTEIQGSALAGDLPIVLHILADVVKNPTFPGKELELTRQQALTDLKEELDDPTEVAKRTFVQSVYPKTHPLHKFATPKTLQRIRRQDLIAFKTQHYRPDTTVLTLVGDFDPQNVRSLIEAEFGNWKISGQAPKIEYPVVPMPNNIVRLNPILPGKTQAVTYMGNTGINRKDKRYYAALVLNQILGGDTLSSRLGAEIRDRQGLTYGIYSTFQVGQNIGIFLIEMQTAPEDTTRAINSTRRLLEEIHQQGVTSEELETAKRTLISNYNVSLANPDELSYKILMNKVYGLDKQELHSFVSKIASVTLKQVNQAGRELLHPDKIVVVTAGPTVVAESR